MTYKESVSLAMTNLASDPQRRFIGYGIKFGRAMGTMKEVPENMLVETPVAENLMVGLAIGISLTGFKPVVFIERMDFILNALDAIVNHLNAAKTISRGEFSPAVIIRVVVGNKTKPLFTGATHVQDFSAALASLVGFPVIVVEQGYQFAPSYERAAKMQDAGESSIVVEYKDKL